MVQPLIPSSFHYCHLQWYQGKMEDRRKNNLRRNKDSRMDQSHPSSDFSPKNTPLLFEKKYNAFSSLVLSWGAGLLLRKAYPNALYA
jgi:hypothetical protein